MYVGRASKDNEPSIIHHFGPMDGRSRFKYADTDSGIALSGALVSKLGDALATPIPDYNFAIDAKHEVSFSDAHPIVFVVVVGIDLLFSL